MLVRVCRSFALALVLSGVLFWPFLVIAGGGDGHGLFAGRELCYAAGVECGPGPTLAPMLMSTL